MEYKFTENDKSLTVSVSGRIDTMTTPQLEEAVFSKLENYDNLVFDFKNLEYISSAGLRLLLLIEKKMSAEDKSFVITNCNSFVLDVFEMTGFLDILTIE